MNKLPGQAQRLDNLLLVNDPEQYEKVAYDVVQQFQKASPADLLRGSLDELDVSQQTIPFLFFLTAQIEASSNSGKATGRQLPAAVLPEGRLWPYISDTLEHFDPIQVRYVGQLFTRLVELAARGAEQVGDAALAVPLIQTAILRLDPSSSTLTSTHYVYARLCLLARTYAAATVIFDRPIYHIPSFDATKSLGNRAYKLLCGTHESSAVYLSPVTGLTQKITSRIFLEYFLYGGMCYLGLGSHQRAIDLFEVVLTAPTMQNVSSAVQLHAYKKWLLANLLLQGKIPDLPKSVSGISARNLRTMAKPYESIGELFKGERPDRLQAEIQEGAEIWAEDGNLELVASVVPAHRQFTVLRLGKTYAALTLEAIADLTSPEPETPEDTAAYITALIHSGVLKAELVPAPAGGGTVRFGGDEHTTQLSESDVEHELVLRSRQLSHLMKNIANLDHQTEISREYIEFLQKMKMARDKEKKGTASANRSMVLDMMMDEDVMDDI